VRWAMKTQMYRTGPGRAFFVLAAWLSLPCAVACSASNDTPVIVRIEHPPQRAPMLVSSAEPATDAGLMTPGPPTMPAASAEPATDASPMTPEGPPIDEWPDDDYPVHRPWSKNVPERDCVDDGECGDGYCDRGHCAAIWNWTYGRRCIKGKILHTREDVTDDCDGICLKGRCRSCISDAECVKKRGDPIAQCVPNKFASPHRRMCIVDPPNQLPSIPPPGPP